MSEHLTDGGRPESTSDLTCEIGGDERPSEAVVRAVAALEDARPLDLEPLYDAIDPGHLDGLFGGDGVAQMGPSITFAYEGYEVTVTGDAVALHEASE